MLEEQKAAPLTNVGEITDRHKATKISVSELNALLRCTKKHDYAYRQGLTLAEPPTYLSKGSFLHTMMELYQRHRFEHGRTEVPDVEALSRQAQATLMQERSYTVLEPDRVEVTGIFKQWVDQFHGDEWGVHIHEGQPFIEREFYVDLGWRNMDDEPVLLHGVVDLLADTAYQQTWLHEHKTAGRAWSVSQLQFAYQGVLYAASMAQLGIEVTGIQYNFFLPKRFEVQQVYTDQARIENLVAEVQQAIYLRDTGSIVRQPHWGCNDCWYKTLCYPELVGQDTSAMRLTMFKVDDDKAARFEESE